MTRANQTNWTDDEKAAVIKHVLDGASAGWIAARFGITRNSVIGRVHRMGYSLGGLKKQQNVMRKVHVPKPPKVVAPTAPPVELPPLRLANGALIGTMDLRRSMCRWPYGEVASAAFHYCGHPIAESGRVYCEFHCAVAYQRQGKAA